MDISREILEQKRQELVRAISASPPNESGALLTRLQTLIQIFTSYEELCSEFETNFAATQPFIEFEISDGALSNNYLNLREAIDHGIVAVGQTIRISFPGTTLNSIQSDIKANGYLRERSAIRCFYEFTNLRNTERKVRFTRTGEDEYTLTQVPSSIEQDSDVLATRRLPAFRFSMCGIDVGEQLAFADDPTIVCTVCDDKNVLYQGQRYSLSSLAMKLRGTAYPQSGPRCFTYNGELLCDRRERLESQG